MDKITIHSFARGKYHPIFGGKAMNYMVVSGPRPFGANRGVSGEFSADGGRERRTFRSGPNFSSEEARSAALAYASELVVTEGLEFVAKLSKADYERPVDETIDLTGDIKDARVKKLYETVIRPGQQRFRRELMDAYGGACAFTGCAVSEVLAGAHIRPYLGELTNLLTNGLLLRADLHLLFDANLIAINADLTLMVSRRLSDTEYFALSGKPIRSPDGTTKKPNIGAIEWRRSRLNPE